MISRLWVLISLSSLFLFLADLPPPLTVEQLGSRVLAEQRQKKMQVRTVLKAAVMCALSLSLSLSLSFFLSLSLYPSISWNLHLCVKVSLCSFWFLFSCSLTGGRHFGDWNGSGRNRRQRRCPHGGNRGRRGERKITCIHWRCIDSLAHISGFFFFFFQSEHFCHTLIVWMFVWAAQTSIHLPVDSSLTTAIAMLSVLLGSQDAMDMDDDDEDEEVEEVEAEQPPQPPLPPPSVSEIPAGVEVRKDYNPKQSMCTIRLEAFGSLLFLSV